MKTKQIIIAIMLAVIPFWSFAQEWDDIYATPSSKNKEKTIKSDSQKKKVVIVEGKGTDIEIQSETRDIDEYNRRGSDALAEGEMSQDSLYEDYEYTDRIIKYHDPENSIKISGVDEVTVVYVDDDIYSDYYRNRGYYGSMYYPWYTYDYMYDPWFYGCWGCNAYYYGWYNPWYRPWGFSFYYNPWYYGSWYYSPWYYNSYWYYGGGGYYNGFYDGYYSALTTNRSGRSSGTLRTSSANSSRLSNSGRTSSMARTSSSSRISSHSSRDVSSAYGRSDARTGRTRIVDNSGRVVDSRTGRTISRETTSRQRPGNFNNSTTTSRPTSTYQRDAVQRRTNSAPTSVNRPTRTRNYDSNSGGSSFGNRPSRNSSFSGSSSSSSSSSRSSSFGSSSSSSSRSSGSSGRTSSGRRN